MGMFNNVRYSAGCFNCGEILGDFQSKDGNCDLTTLEPHEVDKFYDLCPECDAWNEYHVTKDLNGVILSIDLVMQDDLPDNYKLSEESKKYSQTSFSNK